jgi:hypothetical protein
MGLCVACGRSAQPKPAALQTHSDIKGASLVPLGTLTRSPENGKLDENCEGYRAKTLTALGKQVEALGWIVTSEAPLGRYRVVTFASGFDLGTSSICSARNANIGVFDGSTLVALAYTARKADLRLGVVESLEGGALLVWGGDGVGAPVGELHAEDAALRFTSISQERTFCNGQAVVPNVYAKPFDAARKILIARGWKPQRPDEKPGEYDLAAEFAKKGVIEAESCAGTGVGYCAFNYRGPAGTLSVTTVGGEEELKDNTVVNYSVACKGQR